MINTSPTALDFARVIAGDHRGILLHTGGNEYGESAAWPDEEPTVPWVVLLKDGRGQFSTLAFDFDSGKGDAISDASAFSAWFTELGVGHVMVRSGPTEGRHILARFEPHVPEVFAAKLGRAAKKHYPSLDLFPLGTFRTAAIRPPGSAHRNGGRSEILGDPAEALAILKRPNDPHLLLGFWEEGERWRYDCLLTSCPSLNAVRDRVTRATWELLKSGEKTYGDDSPSGVLWSALLGMIRAGLPFSEVAHVVQHPDLGIAATVKSSAEAHHRRDILGHLRSEWLRASQWAAANGRFYGPNDARVVLSAMSDAAQLSAQSWKGKAGGTDLLVLEGLIGIGLEVGRLQITASHRRLAEKVRLGHDAVTRSLRRLEQRGWITVVSPGRRDEGTTFRLQIPKSLPISMSNNHGGCDLIGSSSGILVRDSMHDAFASGGLSKGCQRILSAMDLVEGVTPKILREKTGRSLSSIYSNLHKLEAQDLLTKQPDGTWMLSAEGNLDVVAKRLGTAGYTEKKRQTHELDRQRYKQRRLEIFGHGITDVPDPETGEIQQIVRIGRGLPNPLIDAVVDLAHAYRQWTGTAAELYQLFDRKPSEKWPASATAMCTKLIEEERQLQLHHVHVAIELVGDETVVTIVESTGTPPPSQPTSSS